MNCRHCSSELRTSLVDLGTSPPSNAYLTKEMLEEPERQIPLRVMVCEECWLVQTEDYVSSEDVFDENYAYFSSYSPSWLSQCERFAENSVSRFGLDGQSWVVEVASNDGYLLQYFQARGIPCLGIEPTASTAATSRTKGIRTIEEFFGSALGEQLAHERRADLTVAMNVLAHVPDINDFAAGFASILAPSGIAVFEFPHLLRLIEGGQFDTIYHEHFSYLSLQAVERIMGSVGLQVFDVEELPSHGGSVRVFAQPAASSVHPRSSQLQDLVDAEHQAGVGSASFYTGLQAVADMCRDQLLEFLTEQHRAGRSVAAYGAAAKGNTLLNYAGVDPSLITLVADANPAKQGKYLPGSHIPIVPEERLADLHPDFVVILPWNLKDEIATQLGYMHAGGTRFVTAVPDLEVLP